MLWATLVKGETPPYLATNRGKRRRTTLPTQAMTIVDVARSSTDLTLWLQPADGEPVIWTPGQFFTLHHTVDGRPHRRAYSISSDPAETARVRITVRKIDNGVVSGALYENAHVGMQLSVLGPSGRFVWPQASALADGDEPVVLVGGGSGLTPLMSILYAVLRTGSHRVELRYANRDGDLGLYAEELEALADRSPKLTLTRISGHLQASDLQDIAPSASVYICGPSGMMDAATAALASHPADRLHTETFHSVAKQAGSTKPQPAIFELDGATYRTEVMPGETLLEAGRRAGATLPFSCAMGGCGACKMTLTNGRVAAETPNCLTAQESAAGEVLTCVSRPLSPVAVRHSTNARGTAGGTT